MTMYKPEVSITQIRKLLIQMTLDSSVFQTGCIPHNSELLITSATRIITIIQFYEEARIKGFCNPHTNLS